MAAINQHLSLFTALAVCFLSVRLRQKSATFYPWSGNILFIDLDWITNVNIKIFFLFELCLRLFDSVNNEFRLMHPRTFIWLEAASLPIFQILQHSEGEVSGPVLTVEKCDCPEGYTGKYSKKRAVLWTRDILVRIWVRGSVPLTSGSSYPEPAFFVSGWQAKK